MREEDLKRITDKISETVGEDVAATIAGDFGELLTLNSKTIDSLNEKDKRIAELEDTNSKLVTANGQLLQQIPMGKTNPIDSVKKEDATPHVSYNMRDAFDEKGNFIN